MNLRDNIAFISLLIVNFAILLLTTAFPPLLEVLAASSSDFISGPASIFLGILHLFSHMFAHAGFDHYAGNFMFFAPAALFLEPRIGSRKFLAVYGIAGLGGLFLFAFTPRVVPWGYCLGASSAISGIYAYAFCGVGKTGKLAACLAFLALGLVMYEQLIPAIISCFEPMGIAYWGHYGAMVVGVMLAAFTKESNHRH